MRVSCGLILFVAAVGCSDGMNGPGGIDAAPAPDVLVPAPDAGAPGASLGSFELTYYYVTAENDYTTTPDTTLYEPSCDVLAIVPAAFAHSLAIEGTGQ